MHACVMHPCVCARTCLCGIFEELNPLLGCVCCPESLGGPSMPSSPPQPPYPTAPSPQAFSALRPHPKSDLFSPSPNTPGLPTSLLPGFSSLPSAARGSCGNLNLSVAPHPLLWGILVFVLLSLPRLAGCVLPVPGLSLYAEFPGMLLHPMPGRGLPALTQVPTCCGGDICCPYLMPPRGGVLFVWFSCLLALRTWPGTQQVLKKYPNE